MGINRFEGLGRIGQDPECKTSKAGKSYVSLSIAIDDSYKSDSGEWVKVTEWVNCIAFGALADRIARRMRKGYRLLAVGKIKTRKYTDKSGQERIVTEVVLGDGTTCIDEEKEPDTGRSNGGRSNQYRGGGVEDDIPY